MTREETAKILAIISATYPSFKPTDKTSTIEAWHFFLSDHSYQDISIALKTFVNTSGKGFPPSVDQLIAMARKPEELMQITEGEAWAMVRRAISRSGWNPEREYMKLPPDVQRAVGSASQLYSWATDEEFNESVVQSQFLRSYRITSERSRELKCLPQEAMARLAEVQRIALGMKENE